MRRFELHRHRDVSGVSGTGVVAQGVRFADGSVAIRWHGEWATTTIHDRGVDSVEHIHGHGGSTDIVWLD